MKPKHLFVSSLIAAGALTVSGGALARAGDREQRETIQPDISSPNTSYGGTQSERWSSGAPAPEGSGGTVKMGQAHTPEVVKDAQEALRDKGYNPGPVDGTMGEPTREALKKFQTDMGLEETGTLNAETAQMLGVDIPGVPQSS